MGLDGSKEGYVDASELFASRTYDLEYSDLPQDAVDAAKRGILDVFGIMMAATGMAHSETDPFERFLKNACVSDGIPCLGYGHRVSVFDAVFWCGALAHAIDYDDYADIVHPSAPVVSVLPLAFGERRVSGREAIVAVAVGQDLINRIGFALGHSMGDDGWLPPGAMGAALAAGRILGLSAQQLRSSLGLAIHRPSGTYQSMVGSGSSYRAVRDAFNAQSGALVSELARLGLRGDQEGMEGPHGLFHHYFGGDYDADLLRGGVGEVFYGGRTTFKPWPSAGHTHLYLTAVQDLVEAGLPFAPANIRAIRLTGGSNLLRQQCEPRADRVRPRTSIDAKVSIPFLVGKLLANGSVVLSDFTPAGLDDPRAHEFADLVEWSHNSEFRRQGEGFGPAEVLIQGVDGQQVSTRIEFPLGHPSRPLSWSQLEGKFRECLGVSDISVPSADVEEFIGLVRDLDAVEDVTTLFKLLTPGG